MAWVEPGSSSGSACQRDEPTSDADFSGGLVTGLEGGRGVGWGGGRAGRAGREVKPFLCNVHGLRSDPV